MVEMEALSMIDMINQHILPSCKAAGVGPVRKLNGCVGTLKSKLHEIHEEADEVTRATKARNLRLEAMIDIRKTCDETEGIIPANLWTLATYKELLFLDQEVDNYAF